MISQMEYQECHDYGTHLILLRRFTEPVRR